MAVDSLASRLAAIHAKDVNVLNAFGRPVSCAAYHDVIRTVALGEPQKLTSG